MDKSKTQKENMDKPKTQKKKEKEPTQVDPQLRSLAIEYAMLHGEYKKDEEPTQLDPDMLSFMVGHKMLYGGYEKGTPWAFTKGKNNYSKILIQFSRKVGSCSNRSSNWLSLTRKFRCNATTLRFLPMYS